MQYEKELRELFFMQQIYANLFSITNKVQGYGDRSLTDITTRQFMAVLAIMHIPEGEATINQVAQRMGTTKQNANVMIGSLEKKGLVKIEKSQKDKRAVNVTVTAQGLAVMRKNGLPGNLFIAEVFADLTEPELETLWRLLKKVGRFDGRDSDGYEEAVQAFDTETTPSADQLRLLAELARIRQPVRDRENSEDLREMKEMPAGEE